MVGQYIMKVVCLSLSGDIISHNLSLDVKKTKEIIIDYRKNKGDVHRPLLINGEAKKKKSSHL